jgi:DNA-binding GntR family transcriptional regulator
MASMADDGDPRIYKQVLHFLREQIVSGTIKPGMPTPSITALCRQFGCARMTAAKALQLLADEGTLVRYPGMGYYVAENAELPS